ncbi:16S rRNA (guanine(966)-N(2))-methyltransferase RsmD [Effusibacillus dendaii]|nr:16S rRNA (guanine(966)-N(2))-methyltransferase RsmD [Effusibacillus dendaii]
MRVIAGDLKGRRLAAVPGRSTRPTTDKVKESVFNIIGPYFDGGSVLDLFAGTGGLGIEALSRGMEQAVFIDQDPKALQVVRRNIEACQLSDRVEIHRSDARRSLSWLSQKGCSFDLVFLDPPYHLTIIPELVRGLAERRLLKEGALLVAEHSASSELPEEIDAMHRWKFVTYGDTSISFYQKGTGFP